MKSICEEREKERKKKKARERKKESERERERERMERKILRSIKQTVSRWQLTNIFMSTILQQSDRLPPVSGARRALTTPDPHTHTHTVKNAHTNKHTHPYHT